MTEDFVSYSQAVRLKKLGFDWECNHYYTNGYTNDDPEDLSRVVKFHQGGMCYNYNMVIRRNGACYSAPSLSQATKWLRDVRGLIVCCEPRFYRGRRPLMGYDYHLYNKEDGSYSHIASKEVYDTYEAALSAGLGAALKLLEENSSSNLE